MMEKQVRRLTDDAFSSALLFIAFAALALCMPPQNDTWWHLRAGREMIETGNILSTERFSHTAFGTPLYHNHEWLTQLLFYGLFGLGGPPLLAVFCATCVIAAIAGAWRLVQGSWEVRLGCLVLLMLGSASGWAVRPQAISLALFVLAVHMVIKERDYWLPLLCLIWSNMHGVAIVGAVIAGCSALEAVVWSRHRARRAILIALACVLAPIATPLGWHYWPRVVQVVRTVRDLQIQEYRSSFELLQLPFWMTLVALLIAVAWKAPLISKQTRATRLLLLTASVFAIAGAMSVRNVPLFFMVGVPALSRLLPAPAKQQTPRPAPLGAVVLLGLTTVVAAAAVAVAWRDGGARLGWRPISSSAVEAVRKCTGPMFNGFVDGGILAWFVPDRRIFVDSRGVEAYSLQLLWRSREADLSGDYQQLFEDFAIACAAVAANSPIARRLHTDGNFQQQYADDQWAVFTRVTR
jgi:hypothetical protein